MVSPCCRRHPPPDTGIFSLMNHGTSLSFSLSSSLVLIPGADVVNRRLAFSSGASISSSSFPSSVLFCTPTKAAAANASSVAVGDKAAWPSASDCVVDVRRIAIQTQRRSAAPLRERGRERETANGLNIREQRGRSPPQRPPCRLSSASPY